MRILLLLIGSKKKKKVAQTPQKTEGNKKIIRKSDRKLKEDSTAVRC